jgi:acetolactate synthase-1/2/3 large subunit
MVRETGAQQNGTPMQPLRLVADVQGVVQRVISVSGDGGFHFSSTELETAVRLKCHFVHIIWRDGFYDVVHCQEELKYGRRSGVDFGPIDTVRFAESMGAHGFAIERAADFAPTLRKTMEMTVITLDEAPLGYKRFDAGTPSKFVIDPHGRIQHNGVVRREHVAQLD